MTTIKASCPQCGDVTLRADEVSVHVRTGDLPSFYAFTCPRCRADIRKLASEAVVALLMSGGVTAHGWSVPAEAQEHHDGPPLGYDDLLDFALELARTDLVAAAAEPVSSS